MSCRPTLRLSQRKTHQSFLIHTYTDPATSTLPHDDNPSQLHKCTHTHTGTPTQDCPSPSLYLCRLGDASSPLVLSSCRNSFPPWDCRISHIHMHKNSITLCSSDTHTHSHIHSLTQNTQALSSYETRKKRKRHGAIIQVLLPSFILFHQIESASSHNPSVCV